MHVQQLNTVQHVRNEQHTIHQGLMFPQTVEAFSVAVGEVCGLPSVAVAPKGTRYRGMSPAGYAAHREREHGITQELLREMFDYDPEKGMLIWKVPPVGWRKPRADVEKRRVLQINVQKYKMSRMIWIWHFGPIPAGMEIDHRDRNPFDDRIENLRLLDRSANNRNQQIGGASKFRGVNWDAAKAKWRAMIQLHGKLTFIGRSTSEEHAAALYDAASRLLFGLDDVQHPTNESEGLLPPEARVDLPAKTALRLCARHRLPVVQLTISPDGNTITATMAISLRSMAA